MRVTRTFCALRWRPAQVMRKLLSRQNRGATTGKLRKARASKSAPPAGGSSTECIMMIGVSRPKTRSSHEEVIGSKPKTSGWSEESDLIYFKKDGSRKMISEEKAIWSGM